MKSAESVINNVVNIGISQFLMKFFFKFSSLNTKGNSYLANVWLELGRELEHLVETLTLTK